MGEGTDYTNAKEGTIQTFGATLQGGLNDEYTFDKPIGSSSLNCKAFDGKKTNKTPFQVSFIAELKTIAAINDNKTIKPSSIPNLSKEAGFGLCNNPG